ncbi:MAG: hypothetical protein HY719_01100 [Planctomycetes bacterium]|nr:hypothetical protein [Planctomycetota bacterium]
MPHVVQFSVAGFGLAFESDMPLFEARARYARFASRGRPALRVRLAHTLTPRSLPVAGAEGVAGAALPRVERLPGGRVRLCRNTFTCDVDPRAGRGSAKVVPGIIGLDGLARMLLAHFLPPRRAVLVHGASVAPLGAATGGGARGGAPAAGGALFVGVSGAGKSTLARKAGPERTLNDELSALILRPARVRPMLMVAGTPFAGEMADSGRDRTVPLRALCFLHQGRRVSARPLALAEAYRRLLSCILYFSPRADDAQRVADLVAEMLAALPSPPLLVTSARGTPFASIAAAIHRAGAS